MSEEVRIDLGASLPAGIASQVAADLRARADVYAKAEIDVRVGALEDNQISGLKVYETWASLSAASGTAGDGAEVIPSDSGTHTDPVVGGTVANAGRYIWSESPAGWKWVSEEAFSGKLDKSDFSAYAASASDLSAIRSRSMELTSVISGGYEAADSVPLTGTYNISLGFKGWAVGVDAGTDVDVGAYYDAFGFDVQLNSTSVKLILNVYSRASGGGDENGLPGQSSDALVMTIEHTLAEAGVAAVQTLQRAIFAFPRYLVIEAARTYLFAFEARDVSDALVTSGSGSYTSSSYPQRRLGYYRNSAGTWQNVSSSNVGLSWNLLRNKIQNITDDLSAARKAVLSMIPEIQIKHTRVGTPIFTRSFGFGDWVAGVLVGTDIVEGVVFDTALMTIDPSPDAVTAVVKLWRRTLASDGAPGTGADAIVDSAVYTIEDLGLESGEFKTATFTFRSPVEAISGEIYFIEVDLLDSGGGREAFGVTAITDASYTQAYRRGYYRNSVGTIATVASGFGVSLALGREVLVPVIADATDVSSFDTVIRCVATADDGALTATIDPDQSALDRRGDELSFGGTVSFASPATGSVIDEAVTISFVDKGYGTSSTGLLANANISGVVVKDATTSDVLVENSDYVVNYPHGKIVRAAAGSDRAVLVSYDWSRRRYDMVVINPETLALSVLAGTAGNRDAQERLPAMTSADQMPLFMARVTADDLELVPLWDAEDDRPRKYLPSLLRDMESSKRHLRPIIKKLEAGSPVSIAGYGDSIIGCPGISASATVPNGTTRDINAMFGGPIGSDLVSALTLYDQGDGGGAIHHHASHIRRAMDALADRYASTITYLNFGIGGTTSGSTGSNGSASTRLTALTSSAADLVIVGFGMNELGQTTTAANVTAIAQACLSAGKKVVIIGVPRPNAIRGTSADSAWRYTNRALARVAHYLDVAFVDFVSLYDDDCLSAMGLSRVDVCGANLFNHPGIYEYRVMGAAIARILAD